MNRDFSFRSSEDVLGLGVLREELPDDRSGVDVAADAADHEFGEVLRAPGPRVASALDLVEDHLGAVPAARVGGPTDAGPVAGVLVGKLLGHPDAAAVVI